MKCPVCDENLRSVDKHNVQIDICPGCKGIWLDRGELEKIIEYAVTRGAAPRPEGEQRSMHSPEYQRRNEYSDHPEKHHHQGHHDKHERQEYDQYGHKRKKSWLSNLGDIFGD